MRYRTFGRTGWRVGEVGYGMWGMGGWTGSDDVQSRASLEAAVARGVNFFDTAQAYGDGHSERLLGRLMAALPDKRLYAATKVPPKNRQWPSRRGVPLAEVFPRDYMRRLCRHQPRRISGMETIDLLQLHVWEDDWLADGEPAAHGGRAQAGRLDPGLRDQHQPLGAVERRQGRASRAWSTAVQVIYNIFDQAPEDELFPTCRANGVGVIARVPFDEGSLTGTLTWRSTWPADDWRSTYFVPENLASSVARADALKPLVPRRHDHGRDGPAVHPLEPGREHGHSRACARPRTWRRTPRPATPVRCPRAPCRAAQASLGPPADELEPVGESRREPGLGRECAIRVRRGCGRNGHSLLTESGAGEWKSPHRGRSRLRAVGGSPAEGVHRTLGPGCC